MREDKRGGYVCNIIYWENRGRRRGGWRADDLCSKYGLPLRSFKSQNFHQISDHLKGLFRGKCWVANFCLRHDSGRRLQGFESYLFRRSL